MTLPDDSILHQENVRQAIASREEGDWHDFKKELYQQNHLEGLRKDLVAFANTSGGPYGPYRYLIIGVDDSGQVLGLQGRDASLTLDQLTRQIGSSVASHISPPVRFTIEAHTVEGHAIHVIVVEQATRHWHAVTGDRDHGYWIRRHRASVRPTASDYLEHAEQTLQTQLTPLREHASRLEDRLTQLRQELQDSGRLDSDTLSSADQVRRAFHTPDRALMQLARQEAGAFMDRRVAHWSRIEQINLDRLSAQVGVTDDERSGLRDVFEQIESDTRPLVETAATLLHEAEPTPRARQALAELSSVMARASVSDVRRLPLSFALGMYPAMLYLHGMAVSGAPHFDWTLLGEVVHHVENVPAVNQSSREVSLLSVLVWRGQLDRVAQLMEPAWAPYAAAERLEQLLLGNDWVGTTLPVHDRLGAFGAGEAVLSLAYLAAAAARGISEPPAVSGRWWTYTNANAILESALRRFQQRGTPVLGSLPLEVLGKAFDQWEKSGSMVTFKAEYFPPAPQV